VSVRRFGLGLALLVAALVAFTVGYVELFGRVLRDPNRPPTPTSAAQPRVLVFEYALAAVIVVAALTAFLLWRRRRNLR